MRPPRGILFDMDGVLVDSFEVWVEVLAQTARELDCPAVTRAMIEKSWGQSMADDVELFYRGHTVEVVQDLYHRLFLENVERVQVIPGAKELVATLRDRGLKVAVVTNSPREIALAMMSSGRMEPDALVTGSDVERSKPAPDMLYGACERIGVTTDEVWMVGDTAYDGDAARAAGVPFVGFGVDGDARIDGRLDEGLLVLLTHL